MERSDNRNGLKALLLVPILFLAACAGQVSGISNPSHTTILVLAEENQTRLVDSDSPAHIPLRAGLQKALAREGYRMLDQHFAAQQLGWDLHGKHSKADLIRAAKLMRQANQASARPDLLVIYRLDRRIEKKRFAKAISLRLSGEVYHIASNRFIDGFELARDHFSAPANCDLNCLNNLTAPKSREMAKELGSVLARKIAHPGSPQTKPIKPTAPSLGLNEYNLVLNQFDNMDAREIIKTMAREFPGYVSHELIRKNGQHRLYHYETTAPRTKLERWIEILLEDMGFDPGKDVKIQSEGNRLVLRDISHRLTAQSPSRPRKSNRFK